jgi:hypothetical protein
MKSLIAAAQVIVDGIDGQAQELVLLVQQYGAGGVAHLLLRVPARPPLALLG